MSGAGMTTVLPEDFFLPETTVDRFDDDEFDRRRALVLARWPTGAEIADLDAGIAFCASLPASKNHALAVRASRGQGRPLLQVGIGHTTAAEQVDHMARAAAAGADLILSLTDTYNRKCVYDRSQRAIERAERTGEQLLNGFPVVNYGLRSREVFGSVDIPVHISGNVDEEAMLSSEMGFASGATCDFAHSLHDLVQHSRDYDLGRRIQCDQYISHLAGRYTAGGAPIEILTLANYQGLIPPSLGMAVAILDLLISTAQGVRYVSLHRCCEGNLVQDVAAFNAYRTTAAYYAAQFDRDVDMVTHAWPWMGAWPYEPDQNAGLVAWCASIAMLAGVDWIYLKSTHEGSGIPSPAANISALHIARQLRRIVPNQAVLAFEDVAYEQHLMELETRAIVDKALELGDGDPAHGLIAAVAAGVIDIPIASWSGVADRVVTARDVNGAVRFAHPGNVPLPAESRAYHEARMAQRRARDGEDSDINLVIADIRQYMDESL